MTTKEVPLTNLATDPWEPQDARALLTRADRQRLEDRLAELRAVDREMRRTGSLAAPDEPLPLHRVRQDGDTNTDAEGTTS